MSSIFEEIYKFIMPIKEVYYDKYLMDKYDFLISFNEYMSNMYDNTDKKNKCNWINKVYNYILLLILFICIIWIIYDLLVKSNYLLNSFINNNFSNKILLRDIPEFNQLNNIIYIADNFSIDINLIFMIILSIILLSVILYFYYVIKLQSVLKEFKYIIIFTIIILVSGIIYFIINFSHINSVSRRAKTLNTLIYKNINLHFINSQGICNYLNKKNEFDDDFEYGKCNNLRNNMSKSKLIAYIKSIINEAYNNNKSLTIEKFKTLKDDKGIYYKTKISSALYTYTLLNYYINNNLISEAKDIFSTYNLIKYLFKNQLNPLLNLDRNNILVNNIDDINYDTDLEMKVAFNNNKKIYNYVYADFYNINSTIQSLIVDIYNICKYKMTSIYIYYLFITFIMILLIVLYFILNYFKLF
jgi:hypothetical protein